MSSKINNKWSVIVIAAAMTIFLMVPAVSAAVPTLTNPSFETGSLDPWNSVVPVYGSAGVVPSYNTKNAINGSYFALLKTDGPGSYTTISQSFTAQVGDTISGYAFFQSWDNGGFYNDNAMVRIMQENSEIETVFYSDSNAIGYSNSTPWTFWSYTFSATGTYTIEARVANVGSGTYDSYMGLDLGVPNKHYKEFAGITGGGYFLDAIAESNTNKVFFDLDAGLNEQELSVNFSFTEDLLFDQAPIYVEAHDIAYWYEFFPGSNKLSFKVPATIISPLLNGGEPFSRNIYITAKDGPVDTIWITIMNYNNSGSNLTYLEQPLSGGQIRAHVKQIQI